MPLVYPEKTDENVKSIEQMRTLISDFNVNKNAHIKNPGGRRGEIILERAVGVMRNIVDLAKSGALREYSGDASIPEFLVQNEEFFREQIKDGYMNKEAQDTFENVVAEYKHKHAAEIQAKKELDDLMDSIIADLNKQLQEANKVADLLGDNVNKDDFEMLLGDVELIKEKMQSIVNLANECKNGRDKYKEVVTQITELKDMTKDVLDDPEYKNELNKYPTVKGFFNNVVQIATKFLNFITGNKLDLFATAQKSILNSSTKHNEEYIDKLHAKGINVETNPDENPQDGVSQNERRTRPS